MANGLIFYTFVKIGYCFHVDNFCTSLFLDMPRFYSFKPFFVTLTPIVYSISPERARELEPESTRFVYWQRSSDRT